MALVAYRNLMRAARMAFQGDAPILAAAQSQIRGEFRSKAALSPSDSDTQEAIQHAQQVAQILRENVVQGKREETDQHRYKLRIHEHTERGDNDSVNTNSGGSGNAAGGCGCK